MLYNKITIGYTEFMKQQGENLMTKYYFEIIDIENSHNFFIIKDMNML